MFVSACMGSQGIENIFYYFEILHICLVTSCWDRVEGVEVESVAIYVL